MCTGSHCMVALFTICHCLTMLENIGFKLFADMADFKNPRILFNGSQPDIVVKNGNKLTNINCHAIML